MHETLETLDCLEEDDDQILAFKYFLLGRLVQEAIEIC